MEATAVPTPHVMKGVHHVVLDDLPACYIESASKPIGPRRLVQLLRLDHIPYFLHGERDLELRQAMVRHTQEVQVNREAAIRTGAKKMLKEGVHRLALLLLAGYQGPIYLEVGNEVLPGPVISVEVEELGAGIAFTQPRNTGTSAHGRPLKRSQAQ
jgi:hypothetical protein